MLWGHVAAISRWLREVSARAILCAALGLFFVYSWPGFVGWDTRAHLIAARTGIHTDGHPPAVSRLVRIVELFVAGPAGLLVIQSVTLLLALYLLFKTRLAPRTAALVSSAVFLFPPISGVTALIAKDGLMAGFLMLGVALLLDPRRSRQWIAVGFIAAASLMRWNALAATFAPMVLLFRWTPVIAGIRRYAIALGVWLGITLASHQANEVLATESEHLWYWSYAYQDIAGTLQYLDDIDDPTMKTLFAGVPLRIDERLHERFRAVYYPANFYHLMRGEQRLLDIPANESERAAVYQTWKKLVLDHPAAYLRYRWDNFELLIGTNRPPTPPGASAVYVWFTVIAAPDTIAELEHDAGPSKLQARLRAISLWISLTPLYFMFIYFGACFVLLPLCRRNALELGLLLSAIGYELAWFFLAATTDIRYSQWMVLCSMTVTALAATRLVAWLRQRASASRPG